MRPGVPREARPTPAALLGKPGGPHQSSGAEVQGLQGGGRGHPQILEERGSAGWGWWVWKVRPEGAVVTAGLEARHKLGSELILHCTESTLSFDFLLCQNAG